MDWSEKFICIKCNEGGNLLVCREKGCPLAIHEGCMGCPARFDDTGQFYCPYCWYRKAVAEFHQAREYALTKNKALLIFMDEEVIGSGECLGGNKAPEGNGHNQLKISATNENMTLYDQGNSKRNSDGITNQPVQVDEEHKISDAEEGEVCGVDSEASVGSKGQEPSLKNHGKQKIGNAEEKTIQEEEVEAHAASTHQDPSLKMREGENIQDEECATPAGSTGKDTSPAMHARARRGSKKSDPDKNSEAVPLQSLSRQTVKNKQTSPSVNSPRRSSRRLSSAPRTEKISNKKVDSSRRLRQSRQPPVKIVKRKRLLWREEEEKMLRTGVQKFSSKVNNIPWIKILEFGQHVFDETRTPSDLKGKWKNMMEK